MPPLPKGVREQYESNFRPRRSSRLNAPVSPQADTTARAPQTATAGPSTGGPALNSPLLNTSRPHSFAYAPDPTSSERRNYEKDKTLKNTGYPFRPNSHLSIHDLPPPPHIDRPPNPHAKQLQEQPPLRGYISPYSSNSPRPNFPRLSMQSPSDVMAEAPFQPSQPSLKDLDEEDTEDDDWAPTVILKGFPLERDYKYYDRVIEHATTGYWFEEYTVPPRRRRSRRVDSVPTWDAKKTEIGRAQTKYGEETQNENSLQVDQQH